MSRDSLLLHVERPLTCLGAGRGTPIAGRGMDIALEGLQLQLGSSLNAWLLRPIRVNRLDLREMILRGDVSGPSIHAALDAITCPLYPSIVFPDSVDRAVDEILSGCKLPPR